jgi:outer membrane protein OmpA-like peptidoglycan-associated protein
MSFNLLDSVKGLISNDLVSKAASFLGENENSTAKAFTAAVPALIGGFINKAETGNESTLLNLARNAANSGVLNNLGSLFASNSASSAGFNDISALLGDKVGKLGNLLSGFAGIKGSSSSSILTMLAPLILGVLGKFANESNLSPGGLLSLLKQQKSQVAAALPSGLNLGSLFDAGTSTVNQAASAVTERASGMPKWLLPLIVLLLAVLAFWYFMKGCGGPTTTSTADTSSNVVVAPSADTVVKTSSGSAYNIKLPNGSEIEAKKDGIEDMLVAFLNDPNAKVSKDTWFDFNDLNFKFGTAEIMEESQKQLNNIVSILKAYPKVKIKVGGYTDKVGDEAANKKLSGDRAKAVKDALDKAGVGSQVTGAEGYGSEFAKYPASAAEEDRVKDRRVSLSVREK